MRAALLDRRPQRRAALEQVLLAGELAERRGPHAGGERQLRRIGHSTRASVNPRDRRAAPCWKSGSASGARSRNAGERLGAALGLVLPDEVAGLLDQDQLGVRQLALEAVRRGGRDERILAAEDEQDRHARAPRAGPRTARSSRSPSSGRSRAGPGAGPRRRRPSSTRRSRRRRSPSDSWASMPPKASRVAPATNSSPVPGVRIACAKPCHLPSGKKPDALITSASTASGCSHAQRRPISPPQSCSTGTQRSMPSSARRRSTCSAWRSQVPGGSGAESPIPARSGATARQPVAARTGSTLAPHVGRLGVAVQQQRDRARRAVRPPGRRARRRSARAPLYGLLRLRVVPERAALERRTTELLQRLIRFNTVNPPGNEGPAQEWLKGLLEEAGLDCVAARGRARPAQPGGAPRGRRATAPRCACSGTSTPSRPTRATGRSTRGRASCATTASGAAGPRT